jgi:hypothetical protein
MSGNHAVISLAAGTKFATWTQMGWSGFGMEATAGIAEGIGQCILRWPCSGCFILFLSPIRIRRHQRPDTLIRNPG